MKKILSLSVFVMLFSFAHAQNPEIKFIEKNYDFGKIKEEDGKVTTTFEFVNEGVAPLVINGVTASCGCTTPEWTKEPVAAGAKGFIKATYNAKGRPGPFKKSITVKSNASEGTVVLTISGEVIPRPKTVEEQYPVQMGSIRLKTKSTPLFDIYKDGSRTDRMEIKNTTDKEVKISFANVPRHIVLEANPVTLQPQATGTIIITFNSKSIDDYGSREDFAYIVVDGKTVTTDEYKLTINSNLREDFRNLTVEQKANAPVAEFQTKSLTVELKAGEKKQVIVDLKNAGKENLIVRKITKEKGISKAAITKATIAPNKSTQLKIDVDATGITNSQYSRVTIITNDPKNPVSVIGVNIKIIK